MPSSNEQKQEFFEHLLDRLKIAVLSVDLEGKIVFCNQAFCDDFSLQKESVLGRTINEVFDQLQLEEASSKTLHEIILANGSFEGRVTLCKSDGEEYYGSISATVYNDDENKVAGWTASIRDISDQVDLVQTETITNSFLAASSDVGRYISEGLPLHTLLERVIGVLTLQLDLIGGGIYLVDDKHINAKLAVYRNFDATFVKTIENLNLELSFIQKIIQNHRPTLLTECLDPQLRLSHVIKKLGYQNTVSIPLFYKETLVGFLKLIPPERFGELEIGLLESLGSQIALAIGNSLLVSDLRESERKYSTVVERANDGIMISQDGVFQLVNKRLADMLEYSVSEMNGMSITRIMDPKQKQEIMEHYEARITGAVPSEIYPGTLCTKSGKVIQVEFNACTIQYDGLPASLSFVRDISQRLSLRSQLLEQKEMAEFFNDVLTHDINNFCHTMLGNLDTLQTELPDNIDPIFTSRIQICSKTVKKISYIIDRVRELMHIQVIKPENLIPQNLKDVITEAIEVAQESFPREKIQIRSEISKDTYILGNNLLVLVFINLLTNAVRHNDKDEKKIEVLLEPATIGGRAAWRVDICDNGPGIAEENKTKIFQRFARFSKKKGVGLWLSIVSALTNKLSGELMIPDKSNSTLKGATISVILPQA